MNNRGFSLMELLIVITLIGILSAMGTFAFSQYSKKSQMATQTRLLYGNLMEYRIKSLYEKKNWTFKMSPTGYGIYSSADTSVSPVATVALKHLITSNVAEIGFDTMGMTNNTGTVCVVSANDAAVDSVVISKTRIKIGKKKEGMNCEADNVDAR